MTGRLQLVEQLKQIGVWNKNIPVHLLGCSLPIEFHMQNTPNIRSCDTSNPVMAGITGMRYSPTGLHEKPKGLLADNLDIVLNETQLNCIEYNIAQFRKLTNE